MIAKNFTRLVIVVAAMSFAFIGPARADRRQLQEKLDKNIDIDMNDVTIAQALEKIGQKAELKIVLSDEALRKLPEAENTRLSVKLQGRLSDSMTEMLNAFFMRYAVGDEQITIYPRPELEHIIGRPSTKQLKVLRNIYSMRITFSQGVPEESVISFIGRSLEVSFLPYDIPNKIYEILKASESDKGTAPTTLSVLLEQIGAQENKPKWYISVTDFPNEVPMIKMVSEEDFRQAKLDQIIDVSFKDERADVILQRLADWAGIGLLITRTESPWLDKKITVKMQDMTILQAMQNIADTVGGVVNISPRKNVALVQPTPRTMTAATPRKSRESISGEDGYVGKISIPMEGGKYFIEFMLRQSDLPEELKNFREQMIKEVLGKYAQEAKLKKALGKTIKEAKTETTSESATKPQE
jgi:predicted NAD-dependent protein-ADP-ribosyltransferase YbiA (DUF1768 family)